MKAPNDKKRSGRRTPAQGQSAPVSEGARVISPGRRRLLKLAAIALPFLGLLLLEIGLRIGGYGYPTGFFLERQVQGKPVWIENERFGWRFFPPAIARAPQTMVVEKAKPPGTVRIVVLGESAAMGDPEPAYGFARYLEALLRDAFPGHKFEVINAAMTAINSHAVLPIARDCARLNADIWVVYMGNNEVVGPFGSGTVFGPRAPSLGLIRAALFLRTLKTGQLVDAIRLRLSAREGQRTEWGGMEMFLENKLRHDDPQMAVVYDHFARNLADILKTGQGAGAQVVVATVGANLKDCAPFASLPHRDPAAEAPAEFEKLMRAGIELAGANRHQEALEKYRAALKMDAGYAELQFRVADCQWALGQFEAARASYQRARDLDALRFRVDARLNEITRKLAAGQTNAGIWLVDAEQALARASAHEVPGQELFWEHVHLNFEGNYRLARTVAEQVAQLLPPAGNAKSIPHWAASDVASQKLALTDYDRAQVIGEMQKRLKRPPFTQQANHEAQTRQLAARQEALKPRLVRSALKEQTAIYQKALAGRPDDPILLARQARLLEETGDLAGALAQWQAVAARVPHHVQAQYSQGNLLRAQGRQEAALEYFNRALQLRPACAEAWSGMGLCYLDANRLDEAITYARRALKQQPKDADFHYNLGIMLAKKGDTNGALAEYRQALELFPEHPGARYNLGNLLVRQGSLAQAETEFQQLLKQSPEHAKARNNYGSVLVRLGRPAEAVAQYREALRHEPENVEARYNLAAALLSLNQANEAAAQLEEILRTNPNLPAVRKKLEEARRLR